MAMHSDEPTLVDRLDRRRLVEDVADAIADCTPPHVFGVHGDWGLGKTSFLQQLQWVLSGECPQHDEAEIEAAAQTDLPRGKHKGIATVIWFEAWRYQHDDAPVVALLHEMRSQLAWPDKLRRAIGKTAEVTVRGALLSLEDLTKKIGFQASKIEQAGERWERDNLAIALPSHMVRQHLENAIGQLLPRKSKNISPRLVVLIDDLDRCEAAAAYRLLEGLKIYLTLRNCVFVLGMNQRVIEDAIGSTLPGNGDEQRKERAAAYLEKLCQNVWRLPLVPEPKRLLYDLLPPTPVRDWIDLAMGNRQCLPPNPRRIKGLANLIQRLAPRLSQQEGSSGDRSMIEEAKFLLVVAYVYQFHHELFVRWENAPGFYYKMLDWVRGYPGVEILPIFKGLEHGYIVTGDETTPTPEFSVGTAYPDPTASNVFWIESLIHELGDSVRPADFERYLRGTG